MRTTASYIRVIAITIIAFLLFEFIADAGDQWAVEKYPIIWAVLVTIVLFAVAVEVVISALKSILFRGLDEKAQERYLAAEAARKEKRFAGIKRTYKKLLGSKPIQEEHEIILDHNYDGIKELDNKLPPWWVYGFYATILFAMIYMARYHIFDDANQDEEYQIAVAEARIEMENYKKTAKNLVDVNTVEILTDQADLNAGKNIFTQNCVACHKTDGGGGIGPNLTDNYWILGGGIKEIFSTISEGGRDGKGMVAWKSELKPLEIAQVASYVLQFQGTTPADPKDPEGEIWKDPNAQEEPVLKVNDSTAVIVPTGN